MATSVSKLNLSHSVSFKFPDNVPMGIQYTLSADIINGSDPKQIPNSQTYLSITARQADRQADRPVTSEGRWPLTRIVLCTF